MQISPRYDGPPVLDLDGVGDPSGPMMRQRRRFIETLRGLTDEQWATPSRCAGWTVKDVVAHLVGVDQFWAMSFAAGLRGEPTRFLAAFDPVATPAAMVERERALSPADVLERFAANAKALGEVVDGLTADQWAAPVESPPGHVPLRTAVGHAIWDAWVHERDVCIPLGIATTEADEEIELVLRYIVGLSPAFYSAGGSTQTATFLVDATDPAVHLQVDCGASVLVRDAVATDGPRLVGCAVDLIEGLSHRAPLVHDLPPEDQWLLVGLAEVFDQA